MLHALKKLAVTQVRPRLANVVYVVRRGLIRGMRRKGGFGFFPGGQLTAEEKFLESLRLTDSTVYDVGGWEGVYTLFFCRAVGPRGKVFTFEPNPRNRTLILENLKLNNLTNSTLRPVALGSEPGHGTLLIEDGMTGQGSVATGSDESKGPGAGAVQIPIEVDTLDNQLRVHALPGPDLVKIDVEGFELHVLQGMRGAIASFHPRLFIEVHRLPQTPTHARKVIDFLLGEGYSLIHVESGRPIGASDFDLAHSDHVFCEWQSGQSGRTPGVASAAN